MKIEQVLQGVSRLFLDTAPVIYYIERNPQYWAVVSHVFRVADAAGITFITSPITLAECLVMPYRRGLSRLQQDFTELITSGEQTVFVPISAAVGQQAAELRTEYSFTLPDALQIAVALTAGCEAFLTNDHQLTRVTQLRALVIDELTV
ncbi:MAG: PIN domain-containing protein [Leptolyngbyaceae cyanobacterium SU_3_3]|nr:PIN domain-containing protein [Leptolyngbyaceae cyanobacterium SU_3_3]NJR53107.1 PIN domain-containing protein [Leptolyngbyaceae cyanobacterium CSU_1_3]